jgi:hypothetical protein
MRILKQQGYSSTFGALTLLFSYCYDDSPETLDELSLTHSAILVIFAFKCPVKHRGNCQAGCNTDH